MKRFLFFTLVVFCLTGCSWFDRPANVKVIGVGTIQNDHELLVVEIDSVKYVPAFVYTNSSKRDVKTGMPPVEGLSVTAFTMHGNSEVNFIAGKQSKEYLDEYFFENHAARVFALTCLFIAWFFMCIMVIPVPFKTKKKE